RGGRLLRAAGGAGGRGVPLLHPLGREDVGVLEQLELGHRQGGALPVLDGGRGRRRGGRSLGGLPRLGRQLVAQRHQGQDHHQVDHFKPAFTGAGEYSIVDNRSSRSRRSSFSYCEPTFIFSTLRNSLELWSSTSSSMNCGHVSLNFVSKMYSLKSPCCCGWGFSFTSYATPIFSK